MKGGEEDGGQMDCREDSTMLVWIWASWEARDATVIVRGTVVRSVAIWRSVDRLNQLNEYWFCDTRTTHINGKLVIFKLARAGC